MMQASSVDDVRSAVEHDEALLGEATDLRHGLSRFVLDIESTELFRLARAMEDELAAKRWWSPAGREA